MEGEYSTEDSLILSNVNALNDNIRGQLNEFEDQVYRFQAMADAHPHLDYNNTGTEFHVPLDEIEDYRQKLYENKFELRDKLNDAEKIVLAYGTYGSRPEEERELRDVRNSLNEKMRELECILTEISGQVEFDDLVLQKSTTAL